MSETPWHYIADGNTLGPVTEEQAQELYRTSVLTPDTLVWTPGFTEWIALRHTELFRVCDSAVEPPPLPAAQAQEPAPEAKPKRHHPIVRVLAWGVGFAIGYFIMGSLSATSSAEFLGGTLAGLAVGLVPYFIARHKGRRSLGKLAMTLCIVSGIGLGLILAVPVAAVFSIVFAVLKRVD